jgi:predicted NAD/FAD-binding protein
MSAGQRIAVIGSGVSGLVTARLLHPDHDVTVFEAAPRLGGHTHTHELERPGGPVTVDTGFIVFNERTYPNFMRMLELLGVESRQSDMSFSVRCDRTGLEYNGTNLDTLFAQRRNLLRPSFLGMIRDILRFNRHAPRLLEGDDESLTLGDYLRRERYGRAFVEHYIVPMGAAIWSAEPARMLAFPALTFVRFFHNHGMLSVDDRPTWRTVSGGSLRYVEALVAPFADRIRLATPITSVARGPGHAELELADGTRERFDGVVLAVHSDQALALLSDPSIDEREILGAIPYQPNEAVLHLDTQTLPRRRKAWAAWNYRIPVASQERLSVTYDMNILQGLAGDDTYCVTLNPCTPIDPAKVLKRLSYTHPIFTREGIAAQRRHAEVSGRNRTWYCGAWWGYGFHEDGVVSALDVARDFGVDGIDGLARSEIGGEAEGVARDVARQAPAAHPRTRPSSVAPGHPASGPAAAELAAGP